MTDLNRAFSELRMLGMDLDPTAAARSQTERRRRLNTHVYPLTRLAGFHLLLLGVVIYQATIMGGLQWGPLLVYTALTEAYVLLSWAALLRWFDRFPPLRGWDLADLFFAADLLLWIGAIYVTGATASLLFFLPILRVADHHTSSKARRFAVLGGLAYAGLVFWVAFVEGRPVSWSAEAAKVFFILAIGLYIEFSGRPAKRLRQQREAALSTAGELLAHLKARTERLDRSNRSRSQLRSRLDREVRSALADIIGFSVSVLRTTADRRPGAERRYLQRIHDQGTRALKVVEELVDGVDGVDHDASASTISLSRLVREVAEREAQLSGDEEGARAAVALDLPAGDVLVRTDADRLGEILTHLLAAARQFTAAPAAVAVRLDPATSSAEAIEVRWKRGAASHDRVLELLEPLGSVTEDLDDRGARLGLTLADSLCGMLGYQLVVEEHGADTVFRVRMR